MNMKKKEIIAQLVMRVEALENALLKNIAGRDINIEPTQEEPEKDKFAELKEAHRNGAVIQVSRGYMDTDDPKWNNRYEYRIKPKEGPNVNDVCKFWNYDECHFEIAKLVRIYGEKESYRYASAASSWRNAKPLTKEEVIKLLFGNEKTN